MKNLAKKADVSKSVFPGKLRHLISLALAEDASSQDLTSQALVSPTEQAKAVIIAKEAGLVAGLPVVAEVFAQADKNIKFKSLVSEGQKVKANQQVAEVNGKARSILAAERTALNFLQRLSGIATLTHQYVEAVSDYKAKIYDTRKTTPGWRWLEKYAVRVGGGKNHRLNLAAGILIKDNHKVKKSITQAVGAVKEKYPQLQVEVEVETLDQLHEAIAAGADVVLLDNMSIAELAQAVKISKGQVVLEASGGINLENVAQVAATGVDRIAVGALTHSAPALDFSLEFLDKQ